MDDSRKTKAQLAAELDELRQRVAALEAELKATAPRRPTDDQRSELVSHWQLVVDTMPLGGIIIDPDSRIAYWNAAAEKIFGYTAAEALGQLHYEITIPPGDRQLVAERLTRSAQDNVTTFGENANITKSGNIIVCEWHNTPLHDAAGRYVGVLCMAQDITARKQIEEAKRKSEAEFRTIFENSTAGVALVDLAGKYLMVNSAFCQIYGYTAAELLEMSFFQVTHPDDLERSQDLMHKVKNGAGKYIRYTKRYIHKDGHTIWAEVSSVLMLTADGRPENFITHVTDITERRQAEFEREAALAALQQSEERFRIIFEQAPLGIALIDSLAGQILEANARYVEVFGRTRDELVHTDWMSMTYPDDVQTDQEQMARLNSGEITGFSLEKRCWRGDGALIWINLTVATIRSTDPQRRQHLSMVEDITARKQMEEALRASEAHYRLIAENTADVIWVVDLETQRCTYISPSIKKMRGYTPEEVMALPISAAVTPEWASMVEEMLSVGAAHFRADPSNFQPLISELDQPCKDGALVHTEVTATFILNEKGKLEVLGVSRDITERKRAEEQLLHAQKMESLGILAGGVAHDFNNLLVALLGQVSLAAAKLPPDHPAQRHLDRAVIAARRAADLTRQMLAYSGHGAFQMAPLNLNDLIRENTGFLESSIAKSIELCPDLADGLPLINADAGQMQQIIMNLVLNAAEAIGNRAGSIRLITSVIDLAADDERWPHYTGQSVPPGRYVQLSIQDTGHGMSAETLGRIFDPFFTTKFTGRGLGLAAVLGIVRGHRGGLWVESEVDRGTTFDVIFPVTGAQASAAESLSSAAPVSRSVLIIDDEEPVRTAIADMLELDNLTGLCAATGIEGIALYRERQAEIGLVLLDLSMPEISGREVFNALQQIDPEVRVVLTSGYTKAEATRNFASGELAGFLQKPFDMALLLSTVHQHLAAISGT